MKKFTKRILIAVIAISLFLSFPLSVYADLILQYYGYSYTIFNNSSVSVVGWDNRTSELIIPNTIDSRYVISVGNNAMENNTEITSVDFSQVTRLNRIGSDAFYGCTGINQSIVLPDMLEYINDAAFQDCTSLPGIQIGASVKAIPEQCFYNCSALTDVKLSEGLEQINRISFAYCTSLEYLEIPKSVTYIDKTAFHKDVNLVLGVYKDSYAHNYAIERGINYVVIDELKLGDVNRDGSVDVLDSIEIQKYTVDKIVFDDEQISLADVNNDEEINVLDALIIQKYSVGKCDIPVITS